MSASVQNLEEAAGIAAEYISTLDNLPSEVQHLLAEIRHKDSRSQDLNQEIQKETSKYVRHTLRALQAPPGTPTPVPPPTRDKDAQLPAKIAASYAEIDILAAEKVLLSQRVVQLIARARARLENDLGRVLVLQGEAPEAIELAKQQARGFAAVGLGGGGSTGMAAGGTGGGSFSLGGRNPVGSINESLRNALSLSSADVLPMSASGQSTPDGHRKKRPRLGPSGSLKIPSPAPTPVVNPYAPSQRSRLSQSTSRRRQASIFGDEDDDFDADGDADADAGEDVEGEGEEGGDPEDQQIYCFCQKLSYGEMIACDNPECPYQWFHLPCVGLKPPLPEHFYCSECIGKGAQKKKGRRK
ncbi:hypothetical protein FIBSPDRAFT_960502 [Athelia psychrophila]|uniref:Chromatin modification-related protein n=1 Tax=Athelia psychrophila TaxID=1759441 RepID=A0A166CA89_9AGAM|nr:hypothetical protein FIBSPDRAFT_960502 [Fibularhizoctonia sp. CBS 109695]